MTITKINLIPRLQTAEGPDNQNEPLPPQEAMKVLRCYSSSVAESIQHFG